MPIKFNYGSMANRSILYIVVHDTGNTGNGAGVDSHFNYFNGGDRQSSADFFVDDHKIGQFNPDLRNCYTWHCGDGGGAYGITNRNSIGVEICVNSDGDYNKAVQNALELVTFLMKQFNIDLAHVVRHYDASRKNCPASMSANNWAKWTEFKNRLGGGGTGTVAVDNTILTIQKQLNAMDNAGLVEDGISGALTIQAIKNFQAKYGLAVDGIWGSQSAGKMNQLYAEADARANAEKAKAEQARIEAERKAQEEARLKAEAEAKAKADAEAQKQAQEMYRVRKSWADIKSQIGAYADLQNAKDLADQNPDYIVYNSKGEMIYKKPVVKTIEQRLAELEARVAKLEAGK